MSFYNNFVLHVLFVFGCFAVYFSLAEWVYLKRIACFTFSVTHLLNTK